MGVPMGQDQAVLAYLCRDSHPRPQPLIPAKAVAYETGLAVPYIYQLMEGRRTVPVYVFNACLCVAQNLYGAMSDEFCEVLQLVGGLIFTRVNVELMPRAPAGQIPNAEFARQTGVLVTDMGGAIESTGKILADGRIDEADRVHISEFCTKTMLVTGRLFDLRDALNMKLAQAVQGAQP